MAIDTFSLISSVAEPFAFIMAVVLTAGMLRRKNRGGLVDTALLGLLFSASLVLCMSDQLDLGSAGVHDLRGLLIGSSVALFGPFVGAVTLLAGILMRWNIGGPGMFAGTIAMFLAFGGGILWRHLIRETNQTQLNKGVLLGCFISLHVLALFLLPRELWGNLLTQMAPFFLSANILGAILFTTLLRNELAFASEIAVLKNDVNTDHLTGLLNRRGLEVLAPALTTDESITRGRALLYFDIDKFKDANDTYGHEAGDAVLNCVVRRVAKKLRRSDIFARLGGDEFVVVLPDVGHKEALLIAERCRAAVADRAFSNENDAIEVSISIGAIWQKEPTAMEGMLRAADTALYQAKTQGRDKVVFLSELVTSALKVHSERTLHLN